jgi:hypothetical protein
MSGGAVSGNILSGANSFGREVFPVGGTFIISGGARPERVFLMMGQVIFISGPLSSGTVIDLEVTSGAPLTSWVNQQILQLYPSYSSGNLASLKNYFTLGNAKQTDSPYTETAIPANYTIGNDGRMRN